MAQGGLEFWFFSREGIYGFDLWKSKPLQPPIKKIMKKEMIRCGRYGGKEWRISKTTEKELIYKRVLPGQIPNKVKKVRFFFTYEVFCGCH
jgi:hypothetical protein